MGKDSNVLIWLSKKAFCGHIPYPLLHIDTTYEFPEMLQYRDWAVQYHGLKLIVKSHPPSSPLASVTGPFVDRDGYRRFVDRAEAYFDESLAKQRKP